MKKIMAAVVVAAMSSLAGAATVTWNSGAIFGPGENGAIDFTKPATRIMSSSSVNWYVFSGLTESQYTAAQTAGTVYGWLSKTPEGVTKKPATTQGTDANGLLTAIAVDQSKGTDAFYAVLITYNDGAKDWYLENYAKVTVDGLDSSVTKPNMGRYLQGVSGASNQFTAWQTQSVPEPTSGLLLLLGVAGLALKRRRA